MGESVIASWLNNEDDQSSQNDLDCEDYKRPSHTETTKMLAQLMIYFGKQDTVADDLLILKRLLYCEK